MADTSIEWTDKVWNPTTGCTRVSPGCKNCYAFQLHDMRHKAHSEGKAVPAQYAKPFKELQLFEDRLITPLSWRKPQRIFVNSMSDLFHKDVPDEFIDRVFGVMALAKRHTFQVLTKRPERMATYLRRLETDAEGRWFSPAFFEHVSVQHRKAGDEQTRQMFLQAAHDHQGKDGFPFKNVWLGTSVENQAAADERIPHLRSTPAAVRFLSCEPLLGEVNLRRFFHHSYRCPAYVPPPAPVSYAGQGEGCTCPMLHWVIVGGESGPGARPCNVAWVRSIVEQCTAAGVPCFVKQLGSNYADENNGICGHDTKWPFDVLPSGPYYRLRDKKGGDMQEWPESLRVRQFPEATR